MLVDTIPAVAILPTRRGLPVQVPSAERGTPVRTHLIERLNEGLSACTKSEEMTKIGRSMEDSPYGDHNIATRHSR